MKKEEDFSKLSIDELNKKVKTAKFTAGLLLGSIIIQFATGIFLTLKQGFNMFIVLPFAFLPILFLSYSNIKKLKEEIANRKG